MAIESQTAEVLPLSGVLNLVFPNLILFLGRESAYRKDLLSQGSTKHKETALAHLRPSWDINPKNQNWRRLSADIGR